MATIVTPSGTQKTQRRKSPAGGAGQKIALDQLLESFGSGGGGGGGSSFFGGGEGGGSGAGVGALPLLYALMIGMGKNAQFNSPDSTHGKALQALLGPSFNEIKSDPIGTGLPTLLGAPFLLPFTSKSRGKKPEWLSLFK